MWLLLGELTEVSFFMDKECELVFDFAKGTSDARVGLNMEIVISSIPCFQKTWVKRKWTIMT